MLRLTCIRGIVMKFYEKLIKLRKKKGLSQEDLADVLDVSRQSVYKWEAGVNMPDMQKLEKITKYFDVTYDYLLNDQHETKSADNKVEVKTKPAKIVKPKRPLSKRLKIVIVSIVAAVVMISALVPTVIVCVNNHKQEVADKAAAQEVVELIDSIGEVTVDDKDLLINAMIKYEELTKNQKKYVTNYNELVAAREEYSEICNTSTFTDLCESQETINTWKKLGIKTMTATQVFVVAEDNLNNCDYYSIATKGYDGEDQGLIQTIIQQTLSGYRYVNGDEAYFTYLSESSMVSVFKKVSYNPNGDHVDVYNGKGQITNLEWVHEKGYTNTEYLEMVGCEAGKPIDYVVSRKTVAEEGEMQREGENYKFTLKLNAKKAVSKYVKKMKWVSGLADYPVFDSVEIDFVVDKDMNFLTIGVKESYSVNYGITAKCSGSLRYYFDYEDIEKL